MLVKRAIKGGCGLFLSFDILFQQEAACLRGPSLAGLESFASRIGRVQAKKTPGTQQTWPGRRYQTELKGVSFLHLVGKAQCLGLCLLPLSKNLPFHLSSPLIRD